MKKLNLILFLTALAPMFAFSAASAAPPSAPVVTPVIDSAYAPTALKLIGEARQSIVLVLYEIRYYEEKRYRNSPTNMLIAALAEAKGRGVDVYIIINVDSWNTGNTKENLVAAQQLISAGIHVFFDNLKNTTHVKMLVVDSRRTLIGSHNWSFFALTKNHEASVLIDDPVTARSYTEYARSIEVTDVVPELRGKKK